MVEDPRPVTLHKERESSSDQSGLQKVQQDNPNHHAQEGRAAVISLYYMGESRTRLVTMHKKGTLLQERVGDKTTHEIVATCSCYINLLYRGKVEASFPPETLHRSTRNTVQVQDSTTSSHISRISSVRI